MVIVVDDSMLIRHTVCRYFEQRGFLVGSASNGLAALQLLQHFTPDLLVTDLQMPGMTGTELITAVKSRPETSNVPIIVVAARSSSVHQTDEPGTSAMIFKDIDIIEQLDLAVSRALPELVSE
jgi:CheY-like chemotaxis protein